MWSDEQKDMFTKMLENTADLYNRKLDIDTAIFYVDILEGEVTFEQAAKALKGHIVSGDKDSSYFPKPGDLKRAAIGLPDDLVEHAWQEVTTAIERIGPYQSVSFRDPVINSVIDTMGGWVAICETKSYEELKFAGHEFRRLFRHALQTKQVTKIDFLPGRDKIASDTTCFKNEAANKIVAVGSVPQHTGLTYRNKEDRWGVMEALPQGVAGMLGAPPVGHQEADTLPSEEDISEADWVEEG